MSVASPKRSLLHGAEILEKVLVPQDFHAELRVTHACRIALEIVAR